MPQTLHCVMLFSENFHPTDQKAAKKAGIESLVIAGSRAARPEVAIEAHTGTCLRACAS